MWELSQNEDKRDTCMVDGGDNGHVAVRYGAILVTTSCTWGVGGVQALSFLSGRVEIPLNQKTTCSEHSVHGK